VENSPCQFKKLNDKEPVVLSGIAGSFVYTRETVDYPDIDCETTN
jgi:hypothetical protein